jgi:hypothetical protein
VALGEPELPVIVEMISGMRIGGKRRVLLPPSAELSPQSEGGEIAADDTIRFDVEVWTAAPLGIGLLARRSHIGMHTQFWGRGCWTVSSPRPATGLGTIWGREARQEDMTPPPRCSRRHFRTSPAAP